MTGDDPYPPAPGPAAPPKLPDRHSAVWGRIADHVSDLLGKPALFDRDDVRLAHLRLLVVNVGAAVTKDDPVDRDDLERLAAAAINWALDLPDPGPDMGEPV